MADYISGEEAVKIINSGDKVFVHGGAATPHFLLKKMVERAPELTGVEIISQSTYGEALYADEKYKDSFRVNSLFVSANVRQAVNEGRGDYIPVFLSEIPNLFRRKLIVLNVAMVQVSPPDKHGYCSLGVSVDAASAAVKNAKHVIAQVNPKMPRTFGDGLIPIKDFDSVVYAEQELPEISSNESHSDVALKIGAYCSEIIEDGATIQTGIGSIPDAVLASLSNHKELGLHTEMFSDGVLPLIEKGIITNQHKKRSPGKLWQGLFWEAGNYMIL